MPFIQIVAEGQGFSGAPAFNVWEFASDDFVSMTNAEADAALAAVRAFYDAIKANFTTSQTWTVQPNPKQLDAADGSLLGTVGTTTPAVVTGTTAATLGPQQVAILVRQSASTAINNRIVKGRKYLGPFQSAVTVNNVPQGATLTGINTALATLLAAGGAAWEPVIWARPFPGSERNPTPRVGTLHKVVTMAASSTWATQRRRNFI